MAAKRSWFSRFAEGAARGAGKPPTFLIALLIVIGWAASGPLFHFGDTWQLVINTGTTIITFLMVFLIQSSQNRDGAALQAKLDELIRASVSANNAMINADKEDPEVLEKTRAAYGRLGDEATQTVDETCAKEESHSGNPDSFSSAG